jgi:hypothetical protein
MVHSHPHGGDHGGPMHNHVHTHGHATASPHPAQPAPWSILRMTLPARLGAALAVSAGLWAVVLLAMRPS